jgi:pyruvate-ferredoxin/flavodoxin oxidoreductase
VGARSGGTRAAWANSLFEDNAEFGLGLPLAYERHLAEARRLRAELAPLLREDLARPILDADQSSEADIVAQRRWVTALKTCLTGLDGDLDRPTRRLLSLADELVRKSFWIVGG